MDPIGEKPPPRNALRSRLLCARQRLRPDRPELLVTKKDASVSDAVAGGDDGFIHGGLVWNRMEYV